MATENTPLLTRVRAMNVGDKITGRIEDYSYGTVRRYACDMSYTLERNYSAHLNRANRTYTIVRNS